MKVRAEEGLDFGAPSGAHRLAALFAGERLDAAGAEAVFGALAAGSLSEVEIGALLMTLKFQGEGDAELVGAARAFREWAKPFPRPPYQVADTCGTGGDGAGTINISTAVAFTAAAAGLAIVKHGNRAVSSRSGSADVLEALGADLNFSPTRARAILDAIGVTFLLAPHYHPALSRLQPLRRLLGVRTILNLLGPCLNPATPDFQLTGVAHASQLEAMALTLQGLGVKRALIVHGAGLDEIAVHGPTEARRVSADGIERLTLSPEAAGVSRHTMADLQGGDPAMNGARLTALLSGAGSYAERDAVAFNTGALLHLAGKTPSLSEGVSVALDVLQSGAAHEKLEAFIEASHA